MSLPNYFARRLFIVLNFTLVLLQLTVLAAYFGMVYNRPNYQQISDNSFPDSAHLMDSAIADALVSYPALYVLLAFFVMSVFKEFKVKGMGKKNIINLAILVSLSGFYGFVASQLYPGLMH